VNNVTVGEYACDGSGSTPIRQLWHENCTAVNGTIYGTCSFGRCI